MIYLKVGSGQSAVDYSSHITSYKDYNVEEKDVKYTWTDGFGGKHSNKYNTHISGSMQLFFGGAAGVDFTSFLSALQNATSDGVTSMKVWISNKGVEKDIKVTYDISSNKFAELNGIYGNVVTLNIDEAAVYEG